MRCLTRVCALVLLAASARPAAAQSGARLAERVAAAAGERVAFEFPARAGACGDGRSFIRVGPHSFMGNWNSGRGHDAADCAAGPVRVVLRREGGALTRVHAAVGPVPADGATELGAVSAADAADYLLGLAERGDRLGDDAIPAALLGEGVNAGQRLLAIARARPASRRGEHPGALFWAGRYAAAKLRGRDTPFDAEEGCDASDEKKHAVFVMSQLRHDEAVPALIDVARRNSDACVRSSALFWLVESGDDRALDVVGSILGR